MFKSIYMIIEFSLILIAYYCIIIPLIYFIELRVNIGGACGGPCCFSTCIEEGLHPLEKCTFCKPGLLCYGDSNIVLQKKGVCGWQIQGTIYLLISNPYK